jgi:hypothetical protein
MKHWQFFLAILFLFILILPIYESYSEEEIVKDIGIIKEDDKKNNELIGNLTNKLAELRTDQNNTKDQISGNTQNLKSLISNTCPSCPVSISNITPANYPDEKNEKLPENIETIAKIANIPSGTYTLKYKDTDTYCSDFPDQVVCSLRNTISNDEKMELINLGDGYYNIKGGRAKQYCTDEGNNIVCNKVDATEFEKFKIMDVGDGYYNIIGSKYSKYCISDNFIKCEKDKPDAMDKIQITPTTSDMSTNVPTGVYSLKSWRTNNYCSDLEDKLTCDKDVISPGTTDIWKVINLGDGNYNLKGGRANQYCKDEGDGRVVCNTSDATQATKFQLDESEEVGYLTMKSPSGMDIIKLTPFVPSTDPFENNTSAPSEVSVHIPSGAYSIQNRNNKYCSDLEGGLSCTNDVMNPGRTDIWSVKNLGYQNGYQYNLIGGRSKQFCKEEDGKVLCNTDATQATKFQLSKSDDSGYLNIKSPGGMDKIKLASPNANRPTGVYTLQTWQNKYCSDLENGVNCNNDVMSPGTDMWKIINLGDGNYTLKGGRANKYCAVNADKTSIICNSSDATPAIKFRLTETVNEEYVYMTVDKEEGTSQMKITPYVPSTDPFV